MPPRRAMPMPSPGASSSYSGGRARHEVRRHEVQQAQQVRQLAQQVRQLAQLARQPAQLARRRTAPHPAAGWRPQVSRR